MRNEMIEIWRLIASVLIMATHLFVIEEQKDDTPFIYSWIYVEFFFFLSGYFTYRHFLKNRSDDIDEAAKKAISYTFIKYIRFLPFVIVITFVQYTIEYITLGCRLSNYLNMPYEILLLTEAFPIEDVTHILPLWYLSAMIIVLPLICLICQVKNKNIVLLFGILETTIYYGFFGYYGLNIRGFPYGILRAFSGMMAGIIICILVNELGSIVYNIIGKRLLLLAWSFFILTTVFAYFNLSAMRLYVISFALCIFFEASRYENSSYSKVSKNKWIADMSLYMFLWHYTIGTIVRLYMTFEGVKKIFVYYMLTGMVGIISKIIQRGVMFYNRRKGMERLNNNFN